MGWFRKTKCEIGLLGPNPCWSVLEFWKIKLEELSSTNWSFSLQATQAVKIKFKIDKKSSSLNLIFQNWFFRNEVQINRGTVTLVLYVCVGFWKLSHLTRDLAKKKIIVVTCCATDKMTTIFSQNDNFNHFE